MEPCRKANNVQYALATIVIDHNPAYQAQRVGNWSPLQQIHLGAVSTY